MCADSNSTLFESGKQPEAPINSATELSFNPYELDAGLSDRELLAIFVESLNDYAFIDFIADGVSDLWGDEDHPAMYAQLHILREALRLAAARGAGGE